MCACAAEASPVSTYARMYMRVGSYLLTHASRFLSSAIKSLSIDIQVDFPSLA